MVLTLIALLISAILTLLLLTTFLGNGSSSPGSINNAPGIGIARNLKAQQLLQTSLSSAQLLAAGGGGYGSVTTGELQEDNSGTTYVNGPAANATTVSVATSATGGGNSSGGGNGFGGPSANTGNTGGDPTNGGGGSGDSGTITMAALSSSNTCFVIFKSAGSGTWFGAQTGLKSCTAPVLTSAPSPSLVSSTQIGWQRSGFPLSD